MKSAYNEINGVGWMKKMTIKKQKDVKRIVVAARNYKETKQMINRRNIKLKQDPQLNQHASQSNH